MDKKNLPKVKKESFFVKKKNWLTTLIGKKKNERVELVQSSNKTDLEKNTFIKEIKIEDKNYIIKLQRELKENKIEISDLTDEQLQQMIELYKCQVKQKKIKLKQYRKVISSYN